MMAVLSAVVSLLYLLKTISGSIDDEVCQESAARQLGRADGPAHPCPGIVAAQISEMLTKHSDYSAITALVAWSLFASAAVLRSNLSSSPFGTRWPSRSASAQGVRKLSAPTAS
jgi:hypothetical protein